MSTNKMQGPAAQFSIGMLGQGDQVKATGAGGSVMRNKYNLSPIAGITVGPGKGFKESYLSPKVQGQPKFEQEGAAAHMSGSALKIPTITMYNQ